MKAFNKSVDSTSVMADSVNINSKAAAILREAMARKADDGRVVNPTRAASTLKTTPISKGTEMDKATYDNEETWTHMVKQEAAGRMKGDSIPSQKTVAIPELRLKDFNDTRERLPPEFRNPKEIPNVVGMTLTDLPKPPDIVPQIHDRSSHGRSNSKEPSNATASVETLTYSRQRSQSRDLLLINGAI